MASMTEPFPTIVEFVRRARLRSSETVRSAAHPGASSFSFMQRSLLGLS